MEAGDQWYNWVGVFLVTWGALLVDVQLSWVENGDSETHPELVSKFSSATAAPKSLQSCATLCNPIDGSPPGSPIPGILQARTLEWVAISFSNA